MHLLVAVESGSLGGRHGSSVGGTSLCDLAKAGAFHRWLIKQRFLMQSSGGLYDGGRIRQVLGRPEALAPAAVGDDRPVIGQRLRVGEESAMRPDKLVAVEI